MLMSGRVADSPTVFDVRAIMRYDGNVIICIIFPVFDGIKAFVTVPPSTARATSIGSRSAIELLI